MWAISIVLHLAPHANWCDIEPDITLGGKVTHSLMLYGFCDVELHPLQKFAKLCEGKPSGSRGGCHGLKRCTSGAEMYLSHGRGIVGFFVVLSNGLVRATVLRRKD